MISGDKKTSPKKNKPSSDKKRPQPIKPDSQPAPLHTQNSAKTNQIATVQKSNVDSPPTTIQSFLDQSNFQELPKVNNTFTVQISSDNLGQNDESENPVEPIESEAIVLDVYSKMRNLENRYIDLANLYKSTLIDQTPDATPLSPEHFDVRFNDVTIKERESNIIKDLMTEKNQLDQNISNLNFIVTRALKSNSSTFTQSQEQSKSNQQLKNLQQQIFEQVDCTQVHALHVLSQKQNEMFALATKSKISSAFRNESLGLWYDAKSGVLQCIAELKSHIQSLTQQIDPNIRVLSDLTGHNASRSNLEAKHMLSSFKAEFQRFRKLSTEQGNLLSNIQERMKETEEALLQERQRTEKQLAELMSTYQQVTETLTKSASAKADKSLDSSQRNLSPFEKRLLVYQSNSLQRSLNSRSNSRGRSHLDPSDLGNMRNTLDQFALGFEAFQMLGVQKHNFEAELMKAIEINQNEQTQYIMQVESIFNYGNQTLNQLREILSESNLHSPMKMGQPVDKAREQRNAELRVHNEQLLNELKKQNEMYLDVRVENNKLREQIALMQQTISNLNRPIRQVETSISQATTPKIQIFQPNSETPISAATQQTQFNAANVGSVASTERLCFQVNKFLVAMRQLQKAVNRKEKDVSAPKQEFETSKKDLEEMVTRLSSLQTRGEMMTPKMHSGEQSTPKGSSMTSKQTIRPTSASRNSSLTNSKNSRTQRTIVSDIASLSSSKKSLNQSRTKLTPADTESVNLQLNQLIRQVKNLQMEKDKQTELIDELRRANSLHCGEREHFEERMKTRTTQIHKFATQCQLNAIKVASLEQTLAEYRLVMNDLATNERLLNSRTVTKMKQDLAQKETALQTRLTEDQQRVMVNTKADPLIQAAKEELAAAIKAKERELDQNYNHLVTRLAEREEDLQKVKMLFIDKLKELESSFAEISAEVVETDNLHQMAAKKKQDTFTAVATAQDIMERQVEGMLTKYQQEDREIEIENLTIANHELIERNEELRKEIMQMKERHVDEKHDNNSELVLELNEQIEQLDQQNDKLRHRVDELEKSEKQATSELDTLKKDYGMSEQALKKEIQTLKYENKRQGFDLKDIKDRHEKTKTEYDVQFQALKATTLQMRKQMQKEYEQRVLCETKLNQTTKQLKQSKAEITSLESDISKLIKAIEEMREEQRYLQEMRGIPLEEDEEEQETEDEQFVRRVTEGAEEAAAFYRRLCDETRKEFKLVQEQLKHQQATAPQTDQILNSIEQAASQVQIDCGKTQPLNKKEETPETPSKITVDRQVRFLICLTNRAREVWEARLVRCQKELVAFKQEAKAKEQNSNLENKEGLNSSSITVEANQSLHVVAEKETDIQDVENDTQDVDDQRNDQTLNKSIGERQKNEKLIEEFQSTPTPHQSKTCESEINHQISKQMTVQELAFEQQHDRVQRELKLVISLTSYARTILSQRLNETQTQLEKLVYKMLQDQKQSQSKPKPDIKSESQKQISTLEQERQDLQRHVSLIDQQLGDSQAEVQRIKLQLEEKEQELEQVQEALDGAELKLNEQRQEILSLKQTMASKQSQPETEQPVTQQPEHQIETESKTVFQGLEYSTILSNGQEEAMDDCDVELADNLNLTQNDAFTYMQNENERKQTIIDELRAEIDQLKAVVEEAQDQITELTTKEEKKERKAKRQSMIESPASNKLSVGRESWGSGFTLQAQIEEHLKHIRQIMLSFLSRLPFTTKENEDILPVLFSMLNFSNEQIEQIRKARQLVNSEKQKKGLFGLMRK